MRSMYSVMGLEELHSKATEIPIPSASNDLRSMRVPSKRSRTKPESPTVEVSWSHHSASTWAASVFTVKDNEYAANQEKQDCNE